MRQYPIFLSLGKVFDISESYANKIYHKISSILIEKHHVKGSSTLINKEVKDIAIDVSEQPIERPTKQQKSYYSGKKKRHTVKAQLVVNVDIKRTYWQRF